MSEPIIFISTMKIHEGKLKEYQEGVNKSMAFLEENGPQLMAEVYVDSETMIAQSIQIHRDSESILSHWQINDANMKAVMPLITISNVEIYGHPNQAVMEGMQRLVGTGATLTVHAPSAGFNRFNFVRST